MKTKFESNVATEIPKTMAAREPKLPWDVSGDILNDELIVGNFKSSSGSKKPPMGVRPAFLIVLLVITFIAALSMFFRAALSNESAERSIREKDRITVRLIESLKKTAEEKNALSEKTYQLKQNISDLTTQNKSFMAVIENLSTPEEKTSVVVEDK